MIALGCATPEHYIMALERGEFALLQGHSEDAEDAYRAALAVRPRSLEALHGGSTPVTPRTSTPLPAPRVEGWPWQPA